MFVCVKVASTGDISFMHQKHMFDRNNNNNHFGGFIFYVYLLIIQTTDNLN